LFISERKVLLVNGYPRNLGNQLEIVNSFGQAKKCTSIEKFPRNQQEAMGGVINENVVICGGTTTGGPSGATNQCYTLKDNGQWSPFGAGLKEAKYKGAAATVNIQVSCEESAIFSQFFHIRQITQTFYKSQWQSCISY
jgi:hypothetical protein